MTSTNIFTGVGGGRNSSRVLKPPGGGHTDVLGLSAPPERPQEKKINPRNISSITEGTNVNMTEAKPVQKTEEKPVQRAEETPKEPVKQATEAPKPSAPANQEAPPPPQNNGNSRGRVPPGGFSSGGFW
ncbi:jupiter microtubule associated homolog 1 [Tribolium castaneum]|uniref:Microtubule-associated protein Jupiter n=1 Tax=Tribolium castaneum TaxID=7070 RepID=D6WU06_TRICA|nr:PREDICTED: hematological and neurological expressed 1 protein [Tribolium castaneum]EFA07355.1 hypothetical protein TcasGA2_TC015955 [Tribolium castaneum]|eukprot:XP_970940.1 PREDICTED: hematological and neurological expressed 1 protein [Tribolium castaneum]